MAKNHVQVGKRLTVTKANIDSSQAVLEGKLVGVAEIDTNDNGKTVIAPSEVWDLSVKAINDGGNSAVSVGDELYYEDGADPVINKKKSGVKFGIALEAVSTGQTDTINVAIYPGVNEMWATKVFINDNTTLKDYINAGSFTSTEVLNNTGGDLSAGTLVYVSGYNATEDLPEITEADANDPDLAAQFVLTADIVDGGSGTVYGAATVTNLATDAAGAVGDAVYLSETAGEFTFTDPAAADVITQEVGRVAVVDATEGIIFFYPNKKVLPAIGTSAIQDTAVTAGKLATDAVETDKILDNNVTEDKINGGAITEAKLGNEGTDGLHAIRYAKATYDFAADGGSISAIDLGVNIPDNAVIIDGVVDVITTLESATDAATIAIHVEGADDIVSAVAISAATDWDAGLHDIVPDGTAANIVKTTAAQAITATIAVEAVTAGKFEVLLRYMISE